MMTHVRRFALGGLVLLTLAVPTYLSPGFVLACLGILLGLIWIYAVGSGIDSYIRERRAKSAHKLMGEGE